MIAPRRTSKRQLLWALPFLGITGCATEQACIPSGHLPGNMSTVDALLPVSFTEPRPVTPAPNSTGQQPGKSFELPPGLPGSDAPLIRPPTVPPNATPSERDQALKAAYPTLPSIPEHKAPVGQPLSLSALQQMAAGSNPSLRKAQADAEAAYGAMVQTGLYPNPVVGYQADQIQPWLSPGANAGQQGAFISQVIKTAHKLSLAQQVAGYDYLNALVAARKTQVDVTGQIRSAYFALLVAQQSVEINRSLVALADEVYLLQRKQVQAGEAAGYEPLQLYAQALQARSAMTQAEANVRSSWRQLAAAVGQPTLAPQPITGRADAVVPEFVLENVQKQIQDLHTDLLTARNKQLQSQANLSLQQAIPTPDLQTNLILQQDTAGHTTQFGFQVGIALPIYDRNQGNIRQAQAQIASTSDAIPATENDLMSRLAEAMSRYEASKVTAASYRDLVLPNLARAYKAMIRRYQVEPDKVGFNDIIVAQQNLATSLQTYLSSLDAQWKAVVDVANIGQLNDLYEQAVPQTKP
ncbi:MAG TPA: TolC family protein [Gemmatales bacterium]|nr:TolC family protein [Gemmatales bacterium]